MNPAPPTTMKKSDAAARRRSRSQRLQQELSPLETSKTTPKTKEASPVRHTSRRKSPHRRPSKEIAIKQQPPVKVDAAREPFVVKARRTWYIQIDAPGSYGPALSLVKASMEKPGDQQKQEEDAVKHTANTPVVKDDTAVAKEKGKKGKKGLAMSLPPPPPLHQQQHPELVSITTDDSDKFQHSMTSELSKRQEPNISARPITPRVTKGSSPVQENSPGDNGREGAPSDKQQQAQEKTQSPRTHDPHRISTLRASNAHPHHGKSESPRTRDPHRISTLRASNADPHHGKTQSPRRATTGGVPNDKLQPGKPPQSPRRATTGAMPTGKQQQTPPSPHRTSATALQKDKQRRVSESPRPQRLQNEPRQTLPPPPPVKEEEELLEGFGSPKPRLRRAVRKNKILKHFRFNRNKVKYQDTIGDDEELFR